jgi:nucleoside-diphosphate-sugar epimerase
MTCAEDFGTKRVLITGATGFLGGHLTRRLLAEGIRVRVLARSRAKALPLMAQGAELVEGDVTDGEAVVQALRAVSVVYHLAGKLYLPGVPAEEYRRTHVEGTRVLLARCQELAGTVRFVHCSTTGVLGVTGNLPADENAPAKPTNVYEETKLEAELLVRDAMLQGCPTVIVRPGLIYGPGDLHLVSFFRAVQRGLFRPIGRLPVWLHPIYIDDMSEAFMRCGWDKQATGECFHIAGQELTTLAALARTIAKALGVARPRGTIPPFAARAVARLGDALPARLQQRAPLTSSRLDFLTHSRVYDVTKALRLLGFVATTDLQTGIARTATWYVRQGYLPPPRGRAGEEVNRARTPVRTAAGR